MIPLPKYVWPVKKRGGRVFYYFAKFRGTERAWPPIPLPSDPLTPDFSLRISRCDRVEAMFDGARWSWKFTDVSGLAHDLPTPVKNGPAFWAAVDKADRIGAQMLAGERKTFSALIAEFKNHAAYTDKIGDSMREQYARNIKLIESAWGGDPVRSLNAETAQRAIDEFKNTPAAGRLFRATLSRLIGWGIPRGYAAINVAEQTERMDSDGTYDPWPPEAFELFFREASPALHLPVYSALFTGQRKVDVLKMRRPVSGATEMPIVAQKTKDLVPVQMHSEYRGLIAAARADHVMLHLRADGQPWSYEGFKTIWGREMDRDVFKPFREARLVFHGLRKNAVNMLLEVGCTEANVSAIVGMSPAMVHHYSLRVSKFRLARGAMKLLEEGWAEQRIHVLGGVKPAG